MFEASFNVTLDRYRKLLGQVSTGQLDLPNDNFDTVKQLVPENIGFNDETPQSCSTRSRNRPFGGASPEVRAELLEFYGHPDAPYATKLKPTGWGKSSGPTRAIEDGSRDGFSD